MIVRPAEPALPGRDPAIESIRTIDPTTLPARDRARCCVEAKKIRTDPERTWRRCATGSSTAPTAATRSTPDEVVARSQPALPTHAEAAARFELGQHLHRPATTTTRSPLVREAHRLQPDNWTYKRQAWTFATTDGEPATSSRAPPTSTTATGSSDIKESAPRTTTRRSSPSPPCGPSPGPRGRRARGGLRRDDGEPAASRLACSSCLCSASHRPARGAPPWSGSSGSRTTRPRAARLQHPRARR